MNYESVSFIYLAGAKKYQYVKFYGRDSNGNRSAYDLQGRVSFRHVFSMFLVSSPVVCHIMGCLNCGAGVGFSLSQCLISSVVYVGRERLLRVSGAVRVTPPSPLLLTQYP